jgi:hypothetical protein
VVHAGENSMGDVIITQGVKSLVTDTLKDDWQMYLSTNALQVLM